MKRQRRTDGGAGGGGGGGGGGMEGPRFEGTTATKMKLGSKKAKKIIDHEVGKEDAMIPGGGDDHEMGLVAAEKAVVVGEEMVNYWGCLSGDVVDEQMSWGSIWLPFWDVEFMGEAHYGLFCDVIWDDDIWGLRSIKEIPNP